MRETILVVMKDSVVRRQVREYLDREGYKTRGTADPLEALMIAAHSERGVDLLLTEQQLTRISGMQLAERMMQALPATRAVYLDGPVEQSAVLGLVRGALGDTTPRKGPASCVELCENVQHKTA